MRRFWAKVDRRGQEDCWPWIGARSKNGYGQFSLEKGRMIGAHRYAWEVSRGEPAPAGYFICHHCDNPACVNPAHLFLGTPRQNTADMIRKGRRVAPKVLNRPRGDSHPSRRMPERLKRGEENPHATLTADAVRHMRESLESGAALARKFGVAPITVSRIRRRLAWRHVQ